MVNAIVQISTQCVILLIRKLQTNLVSACNLFSHLMYKSIFLLLLLCRAVSPKVIGNEAELFQSKHLAIIKQEFEKCMIASGFCRSDHLSWPTHLIS